MAEMPHKHRYLRASLFFTIVLIVIGAFLLIGNRLWNFSNHTTHNKYFSINSSKLSYSSVETPSISVIPKKSIVEKTTKVLGISTDSKTKNTLIKVLDPQGNQVNNLNISQNNTGTYDIQLKPTQSFVPGKYTVSVSYGNDISEQNFEWGVLAINTNKSTGAIVVASCILFVIVKKFLGKKAIAFISKKRKIIFFVVSVILVALVLWLFSQNTLTKRQSNTNNGSTQTQTKQDVKGASITLEQNTNKEDNKQLIVSDKSWGGGYPIYSEPDKKSAILLISKDGDKFDVIEERSGWYLVSLSNGSGGWLEKTSVKQIDTK